MNFEEYQTGLNDLQARLATANDALANATEENMQECINAVSSINDEISSYKDNFIVEQNNANVALQAQYNKAEQERLQALRIASENANKKPPEEKDPRKILVKGFGGI